MAIYQHGQVTRHELSKLTGLHQTSLNRAVTSLLDQGLVNATEASTQRNKRGRPSDLLTLHPEAGFVVGLEFGREHLQIVVTNALGDVVHAYQHTRPPAFEGSNATMDALIQAIRESVDSLDFTPEALLAVGVALHDVVTAHGEWQTLERSRLGFYDVQGYLQAALHVPVVVEDVSRAFAEAEHRFGAGRGVADMIYVFVGSHGVGGGVFVNHAMLKSSSGICGEIGHVVIDEEGKLCQCGSRGCFETVGSHQAVRAQFRNLVSQGVTTRLAPDASFTSICQAAGEGDKAAYLVLHQLAQQMGKALSQAVNLFGAPHVIIGGALKLAGDAFLQDVATILRKRVVSGLAAHIWVRFAELPQHAGAWGTAVEALERALQHGELLKDASPLQPVRKEVD